MKKIYGETEFYLSEKGVHAFAPEGCEYKDMNRGLLPMTATTAEDGPAPCMDGCHAVAENREACTFREFPEGFEATFSHAGLEARADITFSGNVACQKTMVENKGTEAKTLRHLSSCHIGGLDRAGKKRWYEEGKFILHYSRYGWSREAQWCAVSLSDLGIFPGSDGNDGYMSCHRFSSFGSWSTGKFYPLVILEDREMGISYFVELLGGVNWTIEVGCRGDKDDGTFYMEANSCDYYEGGWEKILAPGERYAAVPALFGCVRGGFEEAVWALTDYKRTHTLSTWDKGYPPVCFNDYMDCLYGKLSDTACIPLIDAAAENGAEIYVMDAGWFGGESADWFQKKMGFWTPNDKLFGEYGFQGMMDHIRSRGMIAGIWTELEGFHAGTPLHEKGLYLKNADGTPLMLANRYFADMSKKEAREHLKSVVQSLYDMGIRYIKNDYNVSTLRGASVDGSSLGEGNNLYAEGVREFFRDIRSSFPDLLLENCGSGAMRCDQGMLSIFHLQSTSDETCGWYNPSIIAGSNALMPPEKAGIWTYSYPNLESVLGAVDTPEYREQMADGEETIFNVVTGMFGVMYTSGRIDLSDDNNTALMREGIATYKKYRTRMARSYPIYPLGHVTRNGKNTAFGHLDREEKRILLGVWRYADEEEISVDLSRYGDVEKAELVYPSAASGTRLKVQGNTITARLSKKRSARLLEVKLK